MKKYLIMFLLAFMPATAHAEHWSSLGDSDTGERLIVDLDTMTFENDDGIILVSGNFKLFGDEASLVSASIDQKYCKDGEGPLMLSNVKGKKVYTTLFYSIKGTKMYDFIGKSLCDYYTAQQHANAAN
jgi:hypothetical protein